MREAEAQMKCARCGASMRVFVIKNETRHTHRKCSDCGHGYVVGRTPPIWE